MAGARALLADGGPRPGRGSARRGTGCRIDLALPRVGTKPVWRSTDDRTRTAAYGGLIDALNLMAPDNPTRSQSGGAPGELAQEHAAAFHPWQRRVRQEAPVVADDVEHEVRELLYGWRSGHLRVAQSDRVASGEISHKPAGRSSARPRPRG
jgi:hypothetical protein